MNNNRFVVRETLGTGAAVTAEARCGGTGLSATEFTPTAQRGAIFDLPKETMPRVCKTISVASAAAMAEGRLACRDNLGVPFWDTAAIVSGRHGAVVIAIRR